ncbi:hypothetical protein BV25DRAFT_1271400 [Artomyces pyxidatus]|uniref:Uncharacterized protein n=1 Tax=Artomyces pyxidatus TaxID=48021 RepID=A0ACB8TF07_9AGAM|nr:hypothetical protein BV25DRAFT_1271400 [Artomyces pyxidatus]
MTTFAKATFDTARYAAARPTYPRQLYDFVFQYHGRTPGARWDTALDLGCGTGQATIELTPFKHVIGVDPSAKMVASARAAVAQRQGAFASTQFEFRQAPAEAVASVADGTVDLVVAAQAAHWFDWAKVWPEVARLLRKDGSAAFWGYSEMRLSRFPALTPLINSYWNGTDPANSLGPYWQQPGRSVLDGHLQAVPCAPDVLPGVFTGWEHVFFTGAHYPDLPSPRPVIVRKRLAWDDLLAYLYTASSLHTFHEHHPEDLQRADGDIALRFWRALKEETQAVPGNEEAVDVEWPLALIMVKKV